MFRQSSDSVGIRKNRAESFDGITFAGDACRHDLSVAAMQREYLAHEVANGIAAALEEDQDRRSRAAQRTAKKSGCTEFDNLIETRDKGGAIGLMEAVLECGGEGGRCSANQRGDKQ